MAKKPAKKTAAKKTAAKKPRVSRVIEQVREPFSLLQTLKEEGLSNALTLLTMANAMAEGAKKNLKLEAMKPQLKELVSSLGFAFRSDLERLEVRLEDLEQKLSEREYDNLRGDEE